MTTQTGEIEKLKETIKELCIDGDLKHLTLPSFFSVDEIVEIVEEEQSWKTFFEKQKEGWERKKKSREEREKIFFKEGTITPEQAFQARRRYLLSEYERATKRFFEKKTVDNEKTKNVSAKRYREYVNNCEVKEEDVRRAKETPMKNFLKTNAGNFAFCPFHTERTASFHIWDNRWYCFGCHTHGDTIDFIQKRESLGFLQAIKYLNAK